MGLKDEEEMIGVVMLSGKRQGGRYRFEDLNFLSSVDSVSSIMIKNSKLYEKACEEARQDDLTGVLNRKSFFEFLEEEYRQLKDSPLSLSIINIDDFKLYNQLYGDHEGDEALRKTAQIIGAVVGGNGSVARYSGKEFHILHPTCRKSRGDSSIQNWWYYSLRR